MKYAIHYLLGSLIIFCAVLFWYVRKNGGRQDMELKKLKENSDIVTRYDSIISSIERKMLDSLSKVREDLNKQKQFQHLENVKLRKQNAALERRFRDLNIGDRPDF